MHRQLRGKRVRKRGEKRRIEVSYGFPMLEEAL
jgi:hypothetical protein